MMTPLSYTKNEILLGSHFQSIVDMPKLIQGRKTNGIEIYFKFKEKRT